MHGHSLAQYPAAASFISLHHGSTTAGRHPFFSDLSFLSLLKHFLLHPRGAGRVKPLQKKTPLRNLEHPLLPAAFLKTFYVFQLFFFSSSLQIRRSFPGELLVSKKKNNNNVSKHDCVRACFACASVRARSTKLCAKLRVAPRSPPEAELRLTSLFSGSVFQLREERDGESICLFRGSSNSAAHGERVQNTAQHKDPSHTYTRTHRGSIWASMCV